MCCSAKTAAQPWRNPLAIVADIKFTATSAVVVEIMYPTHIIGDEVNWFYNAPTVVQT